MFLFVQRLKCELFPWFYCATSILSRLNRISPVHVRARRESADDERTRCVEWHDHYDRDLLYEYAVKEE